MFHRGRYFDADEDRREETPSGRLGRKSLAAIAASAPA
jgi:hypothetical protein